MLLVNTEKHGSVIVIYCPLCQGQGHITLCEEKEHEGYKDSFEQATEHEHKLEQCKMCEGLCLVAIPPAGINLITPKKTNDTQDTSKSG
jgi:hypothetical protein